MGPNRLGRGGRPWLAAEPLQQAPGRCPFEVLKESSGRLQERPMALRRGTFEEIQQEAPFSRYAQRYMKALLRAWKNKGGGGIRASVGTGVPCWVGGRARATRSDPDHRRGRRLRGARVRGEGGAGSTDPCCRRIMVSLLHPRPQLDSGDALDDYRQSRRSPFQRSQHYGAARRAEADLLPAAVVIKGWHARHDDARNNQVPERHDPALAMLRR